MSETPINSAVLIIAIALLLPACTQEVKRQSSYYPGQFSHVHNQKVQTARTSSNSRAMTVRVIRKKEDPVGDFFRGIGNLFGGDDKNGRIVTQEELAALRAQRARQKAEAAEAKTKNPDNFDDQSRQLHDQTDPDVRR